MFSKKFKSFKKYFRSFRTFRSFKSFNSFNSFKSFKSFKSLKVLNILEKFQKGPKVLKVLKVLGVLVSNFLQGVQKKLAQFLLNFSGYKHARRRSISPSEVQQDLVVNSSGSKMVNFHYREAGLILKQGRISQFNGTTQTQSSSGWGFQ